MRHGALILGRTCKLRVFRRRVTLRCTCCGLTKWNAWLNDTGVVNPVTVVVDTAIARWINRVRITAQPQLGQGVVHRHGRRCRRFRCSVEPGKPNVIDLKYSVCEVACPNNEARIDLRQIKTRCGKLGHRHTDRLPTIHALLSERLIARRTGEETVQFHGDVRIARDNINVELEGTIGISRQVHRGGRRKEKSS